MNIPNQVLKRLEAAVTEAFPAELIADIKIEDVIIDTEAREIRVTLIVSTTVDPTEFAQGYFGLTGKMRRSLAEKGDKWSKFFPVVTPSIGHEVHA